MNRSEKIGDVHLKRKAILYIRQSTMRQVVVEVPGIGGALWKSVRSATRS